MAHRTARWLTGQPTGSRLAWVAVDGEGGPAWLISAQVLSAPCRVGVRRDEGLQRGCREHPRPGSDLSGQERAPEFFPITLRRWGRRATASMLKKIPRGRRRSCP